MAKRGGGHRDPEPRSWDRPLARHEPPFLGGRRLLPLGLAGAGAGVAALALALAPLLTGEQKRGQPGVVHPMRLADGSVMRLNGESQARLSFDSARRRIRLDGQGFFEVAKDPERPFTIVADDVEVTAIGTRFNVDAQRDLVEVEVYEGVVEVTPKRGAPIRVREGERALVTGPRAILTPTARKPDRDGAPDWVSGWLEADAAPLSEVVRDLEQASGVRITLHGQGLPDLLVSGRLRVTDPAETLRAIAAVHDLSLSRHGVDGFSLAQKPAPAPGS